MAAVKTISWSGSGKIIHCRLFLPPECSDSSRLEWGGYTLPVREFISGRMSLETRDVSSGTMLFDNYDIYLGGLWVFIEWRNMFCNFL